VPMMPEDRADGSGAKSRNRLEGVPVDEVCGTQMGHEGSTSLLDLDLFFSGLPIGPLLSMSQKKLGS